MGETPKLFRVKIPGMAKLNAAWEQWANRIEYAVNLRGRLPVMVSRTPTGNVVSIDAAGFGAARVMVVTTTIPAATGITTLTIGTTGRARNAKFDPSANQLADDTSATIEVVRSYHTKTFVSGGFIAVFPEYGELWAFDIHDCAKYV